MICWRLNDVASRDITALHAELVQRGARRGFASIHANQIRAWDRELKVLRSLAENLIQDDIQVSEWSLVMEYEIPRRAKYIDAVIVADHCVFVLEFKVGSSKYHQADILQAEDYALELAAFHSASQSIPIIPILIATEAPRCAMPVARSEFVQAVNCVNPLALGEAITAWHTWSGEQTGARIKPMDWASSPYRPTPTIVEAAQRLFAKQGVEELTRTDADAKNLAETQEALRRAATFARDKSAKVICFITGVPGSGKTLAGLRAASEMGGGFGRAVYLSGNGPLVKVLTEALSRDAKARTGSSLKVAKREAGQFIQGVHRFIQAMTDRPEQAPFDHVVVFDEAQRAWDQAQAGRKFGRSSSEPHDMLEIMDRRSDWALLVCLVGTGQQINTGEAGLRQWGHELESDYTHWHVFIAPDLHGATIESADALFAGRPRNQNVVIDPALHLETSIRSYRCSAVSSWINHLLDGQLAVAAEQMREMEQYPVVLTRSLDTARKWVSSNRRGRRRNGLVATSGARRLRKFGLDLKSDIEVEHWFLNDMHDVRSSYALEQVATEYDIQGLELDWVVVGWDLDLRWSDTGWMMHQFRGDKWQRVRQPVKIEYVRNKYRVLLTRAREGMIIWVPPGDGDDLTCPQNEYDGIATALVEAGITSIDL